MAVNTVDTVDTVVVGGAAGKEVMVAVDEAVEAEVETVYLGRHAYHNHCSRSPNHMSHWSTMISLHKLQ